MRAVVDEYDDRVLIGEIYLPVERLMAYYGSERRGVHLPFNFHLIRRALGRPDDRGRWCSDYEAALPPAAGRTGCSATTTSPRIATPARAAPRRASRRCCC